MKKSTFDYSIFVFVMAVYIGHLASCSQNPKATSEAMLSKVAGGIAYVAPDSTIFEGPGVIQGWVDKYDVASIEAHAWKLWGGITALTDQTYPSECTAIMDTIDPVPLATFTTWWSEYDVYNPPGSLNPSDDNGDGSCPNPIFPFHSPRQASAVPGQNTPDAHPGDVLSFNKYTQEFKDYVADNKLYYLKTLTDLYKAKVDSIPQTFNPKKSMMLKPTFIFAKKDKPFLIPYWKGPGMTIAGTTDPFKPVSSTWVQWVLFNPTKTAIKPGTPFTTTYQGTDGSQRDTTLTSYEIVGLDHFYYLPLTKKNIEYLEGGNVFTVGGVPIGELQPGDLSLMIGCHVTSIEYFNDWTWQTFWWSPHPAKTPPASANVKPPFTHYDMEQSYYMIGPDKKPFISQNPYLEPSIIAPIVKVDPFSGGSGAKSNCMSCHHSAAFPTPNLDPNPGVMLRGAYLGSGQVNRNDKIFDVNLTQKRVNTNFLWSMILLKQASGFNFDPTKSVDSLQIYLSNNN
jgi:hypothetical protein